jgi:predicted nucleotidyltransferase
MLSSPLEELVPHDLAMVLTVLERTGQPLTGRTISSLSGAVSQTTTSRLLRKLVRRGLVMQVPGGYQLNREHLAYRAVAALLDSRDELLRRIARDAATWDAPPSSVVVFGSVARQQESPGSDIDLLVVRPSAVPFDEALWAAHVAHLAEQITQWCGYPCEILEYTSEELMELQRAADPLIVSLLRDGTTVFGADLSALLGPVRA